MHLGHLDLRERGVDAGRQVEGRSPPRGGRLHARTEPVGQLVPLGAVELVAAGADAWAEVRDEGAVVERTERVDGALDDPVEEAPPPGVDHADGAGAD